MMPNDEEEKRKIKEMLGYADDPDVSVELVTATETDDPVGDRYLDELIVEVMNVLAQQRTTEFGSPHEGIAHIQDQYQWLWREVSQGTGCSNAARTAALKIAADALWYVISLTDEPLQQ